MKKLNFPMAVVLVFAMCAAVAAHVGETRFYPQHPAPEIFSPDGNDDDWGWFPPELIMTGADFQDRYTEGADPSDYDVNVLQAWTAPPDNRWYVYLKFFDDTLNMSSNDDRGCNDFDCIQFTTDFDHGGGGILGNVIEDVMNGQRWNAAADVVEKYGERDLFHPRGDGAGLNTVLCSSCLRTQIEGADWGAAWPLMQAGGSTFGSGTGDVNVTYAIEWSAAAWDIYGATEAESTRHVFEANQIIGIGWRFHDADTYSQRKHWLFVIDGDLSHDVDAAGMNDYMGIVVEGLEAPTAVESSTWGAIKSHLREELE